MACSRQDPIRPVWACETSQAPLRAVQALADRLEPRPSCFDYDSVIYSGGLCAVRRHQLHPEWDANYSIGWDIEMATKFLTKEGFRKLQEELDYLRTVKRQEVADRLHEAMEGGELIENAEYEAAKNEQAFVEGRIQELDMLLATARVIDREEKAQPDGTVVIGSTVTIQEQGFEAETYTIVGAAEANPREGKISNESPIGKAILNREVGETVPVETPSGTYKVNIIKVK
jgi:transcription elongation factor GreA